MATVVLFDIDGTLLDSGGAGRRAIRRAFGAVVGRPEVCDSFSFAGMTDRAIVRQGLLEAGESPTEVAIDRVIEAYLSVLEDEVARAEGYRVHSGVEDALDALRPGPSLALGLGTGNVRRGALVKLGRAGLAERFGFGGFGCDAEDRAQLLRIGAVRGADSLGLRVDACTVVVVGDTPRDVLGARGIGAVAIAVTTGFSDRDALERVAPDLVVDSMAHPDALDVMQNGRASAVLTRRTR